MAFGLLTLDLRTLGLFLSMILILKRERARTGERLDLEAARSDCASLAVADYITAHLAARQSLFFRRKDDTRLDLAALSLKRADRY